MGMGKGHEWKEVILVIFLVLVNRTLQICKKRQAFKSIDFD
jgi:hypothetical protein